MLAEINWNKFKAKFDRQEQSNFEWLCYLLFCKEFEKNTGISRFTNHAGIENDPIEKDGQVIGWQAKFYSTPLADNKDELIKSIDTAKERHSSLTRIIIYINQQFGQRPKGTDPKYKLEIEVRAKAKGIEIDWRSKSFFESPFVAEENFSIAQYFFGENKGILESIGEILLSSDNVLRPIRSEIKFGETAIKLDRSNFIEELKTKASKPAPIILNGGAGVGKTAVIKRLHEDAKNTAPFFVFKATEFRNITHVNQLFKNYGAISFSDFINEHKDISPKYFIIDSAERLSEIEDQSVFSAFLTELLDNGWSVIFTVRFSYLEDLRYLLKEICGASFTSLTIPHLEPEELDSLSKTYGFALPKNERLCELLRTPLYLSEYLQNYSDSQENLSYAEFRDIIWNRQIQNSAVQVGNIHRKREECFLKMAKQRVNDGSFYIKNEGYDQVALQKLAADEIIKYEASAGGYFITHDVYEEWALEKIIEQAFHQSADEPTFYRGLGNSLPIRRAFRGWLSDKLFAQDENAKRLIEFTLKSEAVESHWKDEVLVSILLSDYSNVFFEQLEKELLEDPTPSGTPAGTSKQEEGLLQKTLFLLRIACKSADEGFLRMFGITKVDAIPLQSVFTIPKGSGWNSAIAFINKHNQTFRLKHMNAILPVLDEWNKSHKEGETTRDASHIALFYFDELTQQQGHYFGSRDELKDRLTRTILNGSAEIKSELAAISEKIKTERGQERRCRYDELAEAMLSPITEGGEAARKIPKEVIKVANIYWVRPKKEEEEEEHYYGHRDMADYFVLSDG